MTGILFLLLLVGVSLAALRPLGISGPLLTMTAAALMFGGAGYVLHGRPSLPGSPGQGTAEAQYLPLARARHMLLGQFTQQAQVICRPALLRSRRGESGSFYLAVSVHWLFSPMPLKSPD